MCHLLSLSEGDGSSACLCLGATGQCSDTAVEAFISNAVDVIETQSWGGRIGVNAIYSERTFGYGYCQTAATYSDTLQCMPITIRNEEKKSAITSHLDLQFCQGQDLGDAVAVAPKVAAPGQGQKLPIG